MGVVQRGGRGSVGILQEAAETYDFSWDILEFPISAYRFTVRFERLLQKVLID